MASVSQSFIVLPFKAAKALTLLRSSGSISKKYLDLLEQQSLQQGGQDDLFLKPAPAEPEPAADPLREAMQQLNPDDLTPREALELLYRLKKL